MRDRCRWWVAMVNNEGCYGNKQGSKANRDRTWNNRNRNTLHNMSLKMQKKRDKYKYSSNNQKCKSTNNSLNPFIHKHWFMLDWKTTTVGYSEMRCGFGAVFISNRHTVTNNNGFQNVRYSILTLLNQGFQDNIIHRTVLLFWISAHLWLWPNNSHANIQKNRTLAVLIYRL